MQNGTSASCSTRWHGTGPSRENSSGFASHTQGWNETEQWADGLLASMDTHDELLRGKRLDNILEMQSATSDFLLALSQEMNVAHPQDSAVGTGDESKAGVVPSCDEEPEEAERNADIQISRWSPQPCWPHCAMRRSSSMDKDTSDSCSTRWQTRENSTGLDREASNTQGWNETEQWAAGLRETVAADEFQRDELLRGKRLDNILEMQSATSDLLLTLSQEINVAHPKDSAAGTGDESKTGVVPSCGKEPEEAETRSSDSPSQASTPATLKSSSVIMWRLPNGDSPSPLSSCSTAVNEKEARNDDGQMASRLEHSIARQENRQDAAVLHVPDGGKCSLPPQATRARGALGLRRNTSTGFPRNLDQLSMLSEQEAQPHQARPDSFPP